MKNPCQNCGLALPVDDEVASREPARFLCPACTRASASRDGGEASPSPATASSILEPPHGGVRWTPSLEPGTHAPHDASPEAPSGVVSHDTGWSQWSAPGQSISPDRSSRMGKVVAPRSSSPRNRDSADPADAEASDSALSRNRVNRGGNSRFAGCARWVFTLLVGCGGFLGGILFAPMPPVPHPPHRGSGHVYILRDERSLRAFLGGSRDGHVVYLTVLPSAVSDGETAVEFLKKGNVVLVRQGNSMASMPVPQALAMVDREHVEQVLKGCQNNLRAIAFAAEAYAADNEGHYPRSLTRLVPAYLKRIPVCPATGRDTYSATFTSAYNPPAFTVYCGGDNHSRAGDGPNRPQYSYALGLTDR